jgi:hypothetical protein
VILDSKNPMDGTMYVWPPPFRERLSPKLLGCLDRTRSRLGRRWKKELRRVYTREYAEMYRGAAPHWMFPYGRQDWNRDHNGARLALARLEGREAEMLEAFRLWVQDWKYKLVGAKEEAPHA